MGLELELKLAMPPHDLERLRRHSSIRSLAGGARARKSTLTSIYYDTPDRRLAARGMALRIRSNGRKFVQTLKVPTDDRRGLQSMAEYQAALPDDRLDLTLIADDVLAAFYAEPGIGDTLAPIFETRIERYVLSVHLSGNEIEIAFDRGEIVAGDRRETLCEAEFELKDGQPEALYRLALSAIEHIPFQWESRSKSERGYALADGAPPGAKAVERLYIAAPASVGEAFVAVTRHCLRGLRANAAALAAGGNDPEIVHQMRVAIRRLRAALTFFRPYIAEDVIDYLRGELKWLQSGLGPARDWDVFALETLAPMRRRLPKQRALGEFAERVALLRDEGWRHARDMIALPRYTVFLLRLELWLESGDWAMAETLQAPASQAVEKFFRLRLAKRARQVLKHGRQRNDGDAASLHRLRIAGKKLRYALEFARPLLKKGELDKALEHLKALQACLGSLNDAAVGERLMARAEGVGPHPLDGHTRGLVTGWQAARIDSDLGRLRVAWKSSRRSLRALR